MQPFITYTAVAAPLEISKIDTGMILPGRFMRRHRRRGHDYSEAFLHDLRFDEHDAARPQFVLNRPEYKAARILVAGADFGCGSSREGAAYAVLDYGLKCLVAPSFGEIFQGNCLQNGILAVVLPETAVAELWRQLREAPASQVSVDLPAQTVVAPDGTQWRFDINPTRKERLLRGLDDIDVTLLHRAEIEAFEERHRAERPWLPRTGGM